MSIYYLSRTKKNTQDQEAQTREEVRTADQGNNPAQLGMKL